MKKNEPEALFRGQHTADPCDALSHRNQEFDSQLARFRDCLAYHFVQGC